jgi:uncharacterized protein (TIGR00730 family)
VQRICVFMGSSAGARPEYTEAGRALARALVDRELGLVYGGARVGLMGVVAQAVSDAGGDVIGVIPQNLVDREVAANDLADLRIVGSMHERKALMAELSDGFVTLPGGLGTLEELFEILTWSQLGLHVKPCGVLDVLGYYAGLRAFLDHAVGEGFLSAENRARLLGSDDPEALLDELAAWRPPAATRWLKDESET